MLARREPLPSARFSCCSAVSTELADALHSDAPAVRPRFAAQSEFSARLR
jgi:hypothetical protein